MFTKRIQRAKKCFIKNCICVWCWSVEKRCKNACEKSYQQIREKLIVFTFITVCKSFRPFANSKATQKLNFGMPDCTASDQSGTGRNKNTDIVSSLYPEKRNPVRYRNEMLCTWIPMPATLVSMPMPDADTRSLQFSKLGGIQTEIVRYLQKISFYFFKLFKNVLFFEHMHVCRWLQLAQLAKGKKSWP